MSSFASHLDGWYDVSNQMYADLTRRAHRHFDRRQQEKNALRSVADFEAYRATIHSSFMDAIGGLPQEKTPLNLHMTGVIEQDGFRIEKILYESLPQYFVSAACYVPDGLTEPAPAVLFLCGHAANGKAHDTYQKVCRDLVQNGFVVLAIDPIGQGERLQFWQEGKPCLDVCTIEHTHAGLPFFLQGASVARHFVWDGIRGFDYLASRPDVDSARIGATGNSGGGTQVCYLMLCEPRLAAAVPCTFPTTIEALFKSGNPQDMEQIIPNCIVSGPDHDDFLTALAPKPVMVGAVAFDAFPIEGTHEAICRAQKIYDLYGQSEKIGLAVDDSLHCYSAGLREACVNWFKFHLKNEVPGFVTSDPDILPDQALHATQSGQILLDFPNSVTISDLSCGYLESSPTVSRTPEELRYYLSNVLGISKAGSRQAPIFPRHLEPTPEVEGATQEKVWFFSAPDVAVCGILHHPQGAGCQPLPVTILLHEEGTAGANQDRIATLLEANQRVFVFDVRGIGGVASRSISVRDGHSDFAPPFDTEYILACDAAMLGLSILGLRVFDVLRAFDYLQMRPDTSSVALQGIGVGALWAYFAAALEIGFTALICEDMLFSYRDLCSNPHYDSRLWALPSIVRGLLQYGDLEDFSTCIAPRPLHLIAPRRACGATINDDCWGIMANTLVA